MKLLGVILSGGKSSRMGTDKGLIELNHKPLIQYAIEALKPKCNSIVISTNNRDYEKWGYPTIADKIADIGPLGGIYSVLKNYMAEKYFVLSCDQPYNNEELVRNLVLKSNKSEIIVPVHDKKIEPLHGIYSYSVLNKIEKQISSKNYKMMDLLKNCQTTYYRVPDKIMADTPLLFKNINTLKDLE